MEPRAIVVLQNIGAFPSTHFGLKKMTFPTDQGTNKCPVEVRPYPNPSLQEMLQDATKATTSSLCQFTMSDHSKRMSSSITYILHDTFTVHNLILPNIAETL